MRETGSLLLTPSELIDVVAVLDGQELTGRQLRYWDHQGVLATTPPGQRGLTRLYTWADVALARLALTLRGQDVPAWLIKAGLVYQKRAVLQALQAPRRMWVQMRGSRLDLVTIEPPKGYGVVALADVTKGLRQAMQACRKAQPEIWAAWRRVPAQLAPSLTRR
jgi:hypothetical protein